MSEWSRTLTPDFLLYLVISQHLTSSPWIHAGREGRSDFVLLLIELIKDTCWQKYVGRSCFLKDLKSKNINLIWGHSLSPLLLWRYQKAAEEANMEKRRRVSIEKPWGRWDFRRGVCVAQPPAASAGLGLHVSWAGHGCQLLWFVCHLLRRMWLGCRESYFSTQVLLLNPFFPSLSWVKDRRPSALPEVSEMAYSFSSS